MTDLIIAAVLGVAAGIVWLRMDSRRERKRRDLRQRERLEQSASVGCVACQVVPVPGIMPVTTYSEGYRGASGTTQQRPSYGYESERRLDTEPDDNALLDLTVGIAVAEVLFESAQDSSTDSGSSDSGGSTDDYSGGGGEFGGGGASGDW